MPALVALDARTGEQVWESIVADNSKGFSNSSGPIVADGKVILGLAGCARYIPEDCYISAYDADNGELLWQFETIAEMDEPGGDTWGGLDNIFRAGGETWITGSYDPDLKLTYWGTAQQKPWVPVSRHMTINDVGLYTKFNGCGQHRYRRAGLVFPARARLKRWTWMRCLSACS
jgi:alcohol dehydrogenase (cytochrome c)